MIGRLIPRWRWGIIVAWAALTAALLICVRGPEPGTNERTTFLPEDTPYRQSVAAMRQCFPDSAAVSEAVIVFERTGGVLTAADRQAVEQVATALRAPGVGVLADTTVRSPGSVPLLRSPLVSRANDTGQAALVIVNIPANFITHRAAVVVDHIRRTLDRAPLPGGLTASVTGSASFGHDYGLAADRSHHKITLVTLVAVVVILLIVYRAPLAALVPLLAISAAAVVAMRVLDIAQHLGMAIGTPERIFVVVLLYGAGTDYSLLLISRCREYLATFLHPHRAVSEAFNATAPAILASSGTDAAGMLMMCFASFAIFRSTGPAVAVALGIALLAALTLVPALLCVFGHGTFWPGHKTGHLSRRIWPAVGRAVTARPALVLLLTVGVLAVPAVRGAGLTWVYDTLADLKGDYESPRGLAMARRHWPVGETAPVRLLIAANGPVTGDQWRTLSDALTSRLMALRNANDSAVVSDVRSLTQPVGKGAGPITKLLLKTAGDGIRAEYVSARQPAMRLTAILDEPALTLKAMENVGAIREALENQVANHTQFGARVYVTGATAHMIDLRSVTRHDFYLIAALVLTVIFLIVLALLRDVILSAFMVATTGLSFLATLGITYWVFTAGFGAAGLDWKVQVFLFVVMAAIGVDYNIFLAARLFQEARRLPPRQAVREAVNHTGPVISSCGVIMAATLGSLASGDLSLLTQLGFAFATGMLLDSFVMRPLVLPAFVVLTRRAQRVAARR